jgi:hypothetical protein
LPPSEAVAKIVVMIEEAPWVITAAAAAKALAEAPEPVVLREVLVPWWRGASLVRARSVEEVMVGSAQRRELALERRELLVGVIGEADSTLLDAVPEDEELEYV